MKNNGGVSEWSKKPINFCTSCPANCRYCYAKHIAVRFKQVKEEDWGNMKVREKDVRKKHRNYGTRVMIPSSHDIVPQNLTESLTVLENLLSVGNEVLIVSKPHLECVRAICEAFADYREQIIFRFSIGAMDNNILKLWEPGATSYDERKACLQMAFELGFDTSISSEPMLDSENIVELVADLQPFVTETHWIGKLNDLGRIKANSPEVAAAIEKVRQGQTDSRIMDIYHELGHLPHIRWKDSISKVIAKH